MYFQAVPGAAVTPAGGGRGDPAGRAASAEAGGGCSGPGAGDSGGAEGCCGPGPEPEQGPLSAAGHRGATVSDPRVCVLKCDSATNETAANSSVSFHCFVPKGTRRSTASLNGNSWSWMMS